MTFSKLVVTSIFIYAITLLSSFNLEFVNGDSLDVKILKTNADMVYVKHAKTLLIIDRKLILTKIVDQKGKIKFNSFHEIIEFKQESDLTKLPNETNNNAPFDEDLRKNNFLFLGLFSLFNGLGGEISYDFFLSKSIAISTGLNSGATFNFFSFASYITEFSSIPVGIRLVPNIQKTFTTEFGYSIEYFMWETKEQSLFGSEEVIVDKGEEFISSLLFGFRYHKAKEGFAFKSGAKILIKDEDINPGLYLSIGMCF